MKLATFELQRALANLAAMASHIDAMDLTVDSFMKQMEGAKHEIAVMRLDLREVQTEVSNAIARLEQIRQNEALNVPPK